MITRIREVRKAKGLTLAEVAERCQPATTAQTIGRLETGMRTVSVGWLNRIARALGVPPSELVEVEGRASLPIVALLEGGGAVPPAHRMAMPQPDPGTQDVAVRVDSGQGDYRAGDLLWLTRLAPDRFGEGINRDVLAPRSGDRFAFGRLAQVEGQRLHLLPLLPGSRQIVIPDAPWAAVVHTLIRRT